jgi:hypothetical protein
MVNFPFTSGWSMVAETPIAHEGKNVGTMQMFHPTADDPNAPTNLVYAYKLEQKRAISPVEHVANHLRALQPQCETYQVMRPSHLLERGVPVSYSKLFCGKMKPTGKGSIQMLKALQGRGSMFLVVREWVTPEFNANMMLSTPTPEAFLKTIFGSDEAVEQWLEKADAAHGHMERRVTLCSLKNGEFGSPCASD